MTNAEKYKTAEERDKAFFNFCHIRHFADCLNCELNGTEEACEFGWLEQEVQEDDE